ncbi:MAG: hypothetical protein ACK4UN_07060, partial [Limisphaerales bacterium]
MSFTHASWEASVRKLLCLVFLLSTVICQAQVQVNITYQDASGTGFFDNTPVSAVPGNNGTTRGAQRRNAFEAAVFHWSRMLTGTVPIEVKAVWVSQGSNTLATASPINFHRDWTGVPVAGRFYPSALANQLAGIDLNPSTGDTADIQVNCNRDWDNGVNAGTGDSRKWYYGTDGAPPTGDFDFYTTMLHELGHGFGFLSFLNPNGTWANNAPLIYDHFLTDGSGTLLTSMNQSQRAAMNTSANLFTDGSFVKAANNGARARIHAPTTYQGGSSISHLDEATYSTLDSLNELMTPTATFGTHNIGPIALAYFKDMGYSFVDTTAPTVTISTPSQDANLKSLFIATGTATDTSSNGDGIAGLKEVRVALARLSDGRWFNWNAQTWGTTFDWNTHVRLAATSLIPISRGTRNWQVALPNLMDGAYELHVSAVDQFNHASGWLARRYHIDNEPPGISFDPLKNNDVVFNFSQMGGNVTDATTVKFSIWDTTDAFPNWRYWNGTTWTDNGSDPNILRNGSINGTRWSTAGTLPHRSQIRLGTYQLIAEAYDGASNMLRTNISVTRSATDTTLPEVTISTPAHLAVITNNFLPVLSGTAFDPESGIANLALYLIRFGEDDFLYWNGAAWSTTPSPLAASYNANTGVWQSTSPLPSGANLPNTIYQIQISAQN